MDNLKKIIASVTAFAVFATNALTGVAHGVQVNDPEFDKALNWMSTSGLTKYETTDDFMPYGTLNREQAAKFYAEFAEKTLGLERDASENCEFSDLDKADYTLVESIKKACEMGLLKGSNGKYMPKDEFTKAQAITVLVRALDGEKDESVSPWYANYFTTARQMGLTNQTDVNAIDREVTRYESALMLYRAKQKVTDAQDGSDEDASEGDSIEDVIGGIIGGDEDTSDEDTSDEDTSDEDQADENQDEDTSETGETDEDTSEDDEDTDQVSDVEGSVVEVSLNPNTPAAQDVPTNTPRVKFLTFDIAAGDEDAMLDSIELEARGFGDPEDLEKVSIYNDEISVDDGAEDMDDNGEVEVDFDEETIKAGKVKTYTVVAKIAGDGGNTYGLNLTDVNAGSVDVQGLPIDGKIMTSRKATNLGYLNFTNGGDEVTESYMNIGEQEILASFELEQGESDDSTDRDDDSKEDVHVKSIKLTQEGSADVDKALTDVKLLADGDVIAEKPAKITDEEVVFNFESEDVILESDTNDDKTFELVGTAMGESTEDVDFVIENDTDIYAEGVKNGFNASVYSLSDNQSVGKSITIKGAPIEVSFDETDADQVAPGTDNFSFGTMKLKATNTDYEITEYKINFGNSTGFDNKEITFAGDDCDETSTGGTYLCEGIDLEAGEEYSFDVTADIKDKDTLSGMNVSYTVNMDISDATVEIEDDNETYTSTDDLEDIFSETDFDEQTVEVTETSLDIAVDKVNDKDTTVGESVVAYEGELEVGDAESITLEDINFNNTKNASGLNDMIDSATIRLDDEDYDDDNITSDKIKFSPRAELKAGETYDISVIAKIEDDDKYESQQIALEVSDLKAETKDSDVSSDAITLGGTYATITLQGEPSLAIDLAKDDDEVTESNLFTEMDKYVRAGSESVALSRFEFDADDGNVKLDDMYFNTTGDIDMNEALRNVRLVDTDLNEIKSASLDYTSGSGTVVKFENADYTIEETENQELFLMADVKSTEQYDETSGQTFAFEMLSGDFAGETYTWNAKDSSGDDIEDPLNIELSDTSKATTVVYSEVTAPVELVSKNNLGDTSFSEAAELTVNMKNDNEAQSDSITGVNNVYNEGDEYVASLSGLKLKLSNATNLSGSIDNLVVELEDEDNNAITSTVNGSGVANFTGIASMFTGSDEGFEIDGEEDISISIKGFTEKNTGDDSDLDVEIENVTEDIKYTDGFTEFSDVLKSSNDYNELRVTVQN